MLTPFHPNYFMILKFGVAWAQHMKFLEGKSNKLLPVLNCALADSNYSGQSTLP